MPWQPEEIRARRFRVALFGYRRDDVRSFLRRLAWDYQTSLSATTGSDRAPVEPGEVERLLRSAQESAELLRLVAELEARRAQERSRTGNGALAGYGLVKAADVLVAAADALERAHRVVARRNDQRTLAFDSPAEGLELRRASLVTSTAPVTRIALATPPPPPPKVSGTAHASG